MPGLTPEGYRVVVYSHFTEDATDFVHSLLIKIMTAIADTWLAEAADKVADVLVMDLRNTRLSHLGKYNLSLLRSTFEHGWVRSTYTLLIGLKEIVVDSSPKRMLCHVIIKLMFILWNTLLLNGLCDLPGDDKPVSAVLEEQGYNYY